ncbi:hypothetical protein D5282_24535 [bacterium 1xD8-48]|nr:hypothetical protein [bacterium 1xD8-48]
MTIMANAFLNPTYNENDEITINMAQCCAEIVHEYDKRGSEIYIGYLGMEKESIEDYRGIASIKKEYDEI